MLNLVFRASRSGREAFAALLFGAVAVIASAAHSNLPGEQRAGAVDTSAWKTYRNQHYGFEVRYPAEWSAGGEGSGSTWSTGQPEQKARVWMIEVRKPHKDSEPDAKVTLGVQENANPGKLSIDEYADQQFKAMKMTAPPSSRHVMLGNTAAFAMDVKSSSGQSVHTTYAVLHRTDVMSLIYKHQEQFDPVLAAIVSSFRALK